MRVYRTFNEARRFARSLKLKSRAGWDEIIEAEKHPEDIPKAPDAYYNRRGYWNSWGDFLGTGNIQPGQRKFWSFTKARAYVRSLNLKSASELRTFYKSGKFPKEIPMNPPRTYQKEWKGMGDWLGTGYVATRNRKFWSYEKSSQYLIKHSIISRRKFEAARKDGKIPEEIPTIPERTYRKQGKWTGYGDFFGTGEIASFNKKFRPFKDARRFARSLKLKNWNEWYQYAKSDEKPDDVPSEPRHNYRNKGWKNMGDWLGTGTLSSKEMSKRRLPPIEAKIEARKIAKKLGIKNQTQWIKAHKAGKIPANLPRYPYDIYRYRRKRK